MSKAKRCSLLFPLQQPLVCMGLEEAMSWRSVVHSCKSCSSCFPMCPRRFSRKRVQGEALLLVVSLAAALDLHGPRRGDILAKRCYLLFPLQQPLICMGLEEAISWRSVVHCCKGCSSCFHLCPRDFLARERENYMRVYGFSFGRTTGESYFCSRKRVITLKRKSGL